MPISGKIHYTRQVSLKYDAATAQNSEVPKDPDPYHYVIAGKTRHFSRPARGSTSGEPAARRIQCGEGGTDRACPARPGRGAAGARGGEALVHRHVGERREALGDEAEHLVGALPGRREARGAAGGALEAAPAAADEGAGVEVALAASRPRADAADHVVEELVGERRVDEVGAPHRRQRR